VLTYNRLFGSELKKLIEQAVEDRKENLSTGLATIDFPTYKHQVGIITGLRMAIAMFEEAVTICDRKERS